METVFKLLVARLIVKASELFKQLNQKPMMSDNYLMSVAFIDFEKLKPQKKLDTKIFIQILLVYMMGWLEEYLDEIQDEDQKNQTLFFLLCQFYKYLIGSPIQIKDDNEFLLLQQQIFNCISDHRLNKHKQKTITQFGRCNAACDKDEDETDTSLALILNEWMQFKSLN
jgi:hypothetical protein